MTFSIIKTRLITACNILLGRYKHWTLVNVHEDGMKSILAENDEEVILNYVTCGLQHYNSIKILKLISDQYDDDDMALLKAKFHAEAELYASE